MTDRDLESTLRELLEPVELVCNAEIPDELVTSAEDEVRPHANSPMIETIGRRSPATLVTYFVIRGSERYERNSIWRQLGVRDSNRAGEAFLHALRRLSLPTFQREASAVNARRFVAPLLVHGAFPASVASRLVERVHDEMRRGLVSGEEARRRLLAHSDIELAIRRPAKRLLEWVPEYASQLLDVIIDYIEHPNADTAARLPHHIAQALDRESESTRGLTRLRPPIVTFKLWQDYGPEVVATQTGWVLDMGNETIRVEPEESVEVSPDVAISASRAGRHAHVWTPQRAWFFKTTGELIPGDEALPIDCVALLPRRQHFVDQNGDDVPETEEGYPLALEWSSYRSCRLDLRGIHAINLVGESQPTWKVSGGDELKLVGKPVDNIVGADGAIVLAHSPRIDAGTADDHSLRVTYRLSSGAVFSRSLTPDDAGVVVLDDVVPDHASIGLLDVRTADGRGLTQRICCVPGLTVEVPDRPMAPSDTATVHLAADSGILDSDQVGIPAHVATVDVPVHGVPKGAVKALVPRVQWGIRSQKVARLDLADGAIEASVDNLTSEPRWLIVRCTRSADVQVIAERGHTRVQELPMRRTRQSSPDAYHVAFSLEAFADTLRANHGMAMTLSVVVDDVSIPAIEIGGATSQTPRTFNPNKRPRPPAPVEQSPWEEVSWIKSAREAERGTSDAIVDQLELRLRLAGPRNAVVMFLRWAGLRSMSRGFTGVAWRQFSAVADRLWLLEGVRYRQFAGHDLDARLRQRMRAHRERIRQRPVHDRNEREQWLVGRVPPFDRLDSWAHERWVREALPRRSGQGVQWIPALVLYHCIALMTGEEESGPALADVASLEPELLLEVVAFLMEALHRGTRLQQPTFLDDEDEADEIEQLGEDADDDPAISTVSRSVMTEAKAANDSSAAREPIASANRCVFEVDERHLRICLPEGTRAPAIRISSDRAAEFVAAATLHGNRTATIDLPHDLDGRYTFSIHEESLLPLEPRCGPPYVHLEASAAPSAPSVRSGSSLESLGDIRVDALVGEIEARARRGWLCPALVSELFEDERSGAAALLRHGQNGDVVSLDAIAVACLPTSMLFSELADPGTDLTAILRRSRLLYACLAPRTPDAWRPLGWPNGINFRASANTADAFVGFVRRRCDPVRVATLRYSNASTLPNYDLVAQITARLDSVGVDPTAVAIMTATHRMLTVEAVEPEAMRTVLQAIVNSPLEAEQAVLAGTALFLITNH